MVTGKTLFATFLQHSGCLRQTYMPDEDSQKVAKGLQIKFAYHRHCLRSRYIVLYHLLNLKLKLQSCVNLNTVLLSHFLYLGPINYLAGTLKGPSLLLYQCDDTSNLSESAHVDLKLGEVVL